MNPMAFDPTWPGGIAAADQPSFRLDERLARTTLVRSDDALTLDEMSLAVEAVISWRARDAMPRGLETLEGMARACLHATIGRFSVAALLDERAAVEQRLCEALDRAAMHLGVSIHAVSIAHVAIPPASRAHLEACALRSIDACRGRRSD